ncbi:hypothetical protein ACSS6W_007686 [Trichoderma asperelloides]
MATEATTILPPETFPSTQTEFGYCQAQDLFFFFSMELQPILQGGWIGQPHGSPAHTWLPTCQFGATLLRYPQNKA